MMLICNYICTHKLYVCGTPTAKLNSCCIYIWRNYCVHAMFIGMCHVCVYELCVCMVGLQSQCACFPDRPVCFVFAFALSGKKRWLVVLCFNLQIKLYHQSSCPCFDLVCFSVSTTVVCVFCFGLEVEDFSFSG